MIMKVAFRADASTKIGTGHVMRCMTLADELRVKGHDVLFITRQLNGNISNKLEQWNIRVCSLPAPNVEEYARDMDLYADWLGVPWEIDAEETGHILKKEGVDWLVVDHYALDAEWEIAVTKGNLTKVMVIDDLANRPHKCQVLLDQTYQRCSNEYLNLLLSTDTKLLLGTDYALLRPEFSSFRALSTERRDNLNSVKRIFINLGGVDKDNITGYVLSELASIAHEDFEVMVVMGGSAPHLSTVSNQVQQMGESVKLKVDVGNIAELMSSSDIAIGAAGSTSWERATLGLPTIMFVLADNQKEIAKVLERSGAALVVNDDFLSVFNQLTSEFDLVKKMSADAAAICDGRGASRAAMSLE